MPISFSGLTVSGGVALGDAGAVGLDLNFAANSYALNGPYSSSFPSGWTFSRTDTNGTATALDLAGNVIQFATGVPRITNRGILVEEARTNVLLRSTEFGTTWAQTNVTIGSDVIAAPDGSTTADSLIENAAAAVQHRVTQAVTTTATATTVSCHLKAGSRSWAYIRMTNSVPASCFAWINLATGALGTVSGTGATAFVQTLADGWYRLSLTVATAVAGSNTIVIAGSTGDNVQDYDGTNGLTAIYIWGAQLEAGAFATSPIITTLAAGTRAADAGRITQPPTASGTIIATVRIPTDKNTRRVVGTNGASAVAPLAYSTAGIETFNGSSTLGKTVSMTAGALVTVGVTWESGRRSVTGAGLAVATDANSIGSFTEMWFGQDDNLLAGNALNESIVRVQVLPYAVTDAQLQALTS